MVNWKAEPLKSVNGVKFGMEREKVRKILGEDFKEFKKSRFSKNTTDDFGYCHVFYDEKDKCEAIEIFEEVIVTINGVVIFPGEISEVKKVISDFKEEDGSYISKSQSIGIYAPYGKMESILLGSERYYL